MSEDIAELGLRVNSLEVRLAERDLERFGNESNRTTQRVGILNSALKLMAAAFAAIKLVKLIEETALLNARFETMGVVMNVAGNNAGYTSAQMADLEKELTKTGISMIKARENLTSLATANIDLSNATKLARAAQDLAVVGNTNSSEAFSRLTQGIKSGEVEVLRTLGLNVNFENSYKKLAAQLGTTSDKLSEQQKVQARTNATLDSASRYTGIYEESMGTAGKMLTSLSRYTEDLGVKIGAVFNEALTVAVESYTSALKEANTQTDALANNGNIDSFGKDLGRGLEVLIKLLLTFAATIVLVLKTAGESFGATAAIFSAFFKGIMGGLNATARAFDALFTGGWGDSKKVAQGLSDALGSVTGAFKDAVTIAQENYKTAGANIDAMTAYTNKLWEQDSAVKELTQDEIDAQKRKEAQRIAAGIAARAQEDADAKAALARDAAAKAFKKLQEEAASFYKSTVESSKERIAIVMAELNSVEELTSADKEHIKVLLELDRVKKGLTPKQVKEIEQDAEAAKWMDNLNEAIKANKKVRADQVAAAQKDIDAAVETTRGLQDQVTYYGMTTDAVLRLQAAQMDHEIAQAQFRGDDIEIERLQILQSETIKQADLQLKLNKMKAATTFWTDLESAAHQTFLSIADGNKDLWTRMKDTAKNIFFEWLYQQTLKKWIINLSASSDGSGLSSIASAFSGGSSSGGGSGIMGTASNLFSIGKTIYSGFSAGIAGSLGSAVSGIGSMIGSEAVSAFGAGLTGGSMGATTASAASGYAGTTAAGAGASAAGAIPIIGWIIAGMMASKGMLAQGWDSSNGSVSTVGRLAGGNAAIWSDTVLQKLGMSKVGANILSGQATIARMFGRKNPEIESQGLRGTLTATGTSDAENYVNILQKGGWFRSDKRSTQTAAASSDTDKLFDNTMVAMSTAVKSFGKAMGIETAAIDTYTKTFDVKLTGDATKDNESVAKLFGEVGDELSLRLVPGLAAFAKEGETASTTLQRLATDYMSVDNILITTGQSIKLFGLSGIQAREDLIAAAGGLDALSSGVSYFQQNFLTQAEQLAPVQKQVTDALAAMGMSAVKTNDQFKAAVLGIDLNTKAGAELYVQMLAIAPAFKLVADAQAEAAKVAADAAAQQIAQAKAVADALAATNQGYQDQIDQILAARQGEAAVRALEIKGMDASTVALYDRLKALKEEDKAAQAAEAAAQEMKDSYLAFTEGIAAQLQKAADSAKALRNALDALVGGSLSPLSDQAKYEAAQKKLAATDPMDAAAYSSASNALLELSKTIYGASSFDYAKDFSAIYGTYQKSIAAQEDYASGAWVNPFLQAIQNMSDPGSALRSNDTTESVTGAMDRAGERIVSALAPISGNTKKQADLTDRVTQGGNAQRVESVD